MNLLTKNQHPMIILNPIHFEHVQSMGFFSKPPIELRKGTHAQIIVVKKNICKSKYA